METLIFLGMFPTECFFRFVAALFRFEARFVRVRIEDSSGNRFALTAYFAKPGFVGRECSGGKQPGWNLPGRIFRGGGIYRSPYNIGLSDLEQYSICLHKIVSSTWYEHYEGILWVI